MKIGPNHKWSVNLVISCRTIEIIILQFPKVPKVKLYLVCLANSNFSHLGSCVSCVLYFNETDLTGCIVITFGYWCMNNISYEKVLQ